MLGGWRSYPPVSRTRYTTLPRQTTPSTGIGGGVHSVSIPAGAYSVTSLCAVLAALMDAEDGTETYQLSYSMTTMKITITCTAAFSLTCTATTSAMWYVIGFNTSANTSSAASHTADNVLRLDFPPYLMVSINEITSRIRDHCQLPRQFLCADESQFTIYRALQPQ